MFKTFFNKFVVVFIDDILVYSAEDHKEHLLPTLQTLVGKELYAKFKKYKFWLKRVTFLGHIILRWAYQYTPRK